MAQFIDDFPVETSIYKGFPMAMLNNQMVNLLCQSTLWWIDAQRNLSHDFSSNPKKKDRTVGNWKLGRKSSSMPSWKTLFYLFGAYYICPKGHLRVVISFDNYALAERQGMASELFRETVAVVMLMSHEGNIVSKIIANISIHNVKSTRHL